MKNLIKLTLAAVLLTAASAAQAEWVSGYVRSNGTYVSPHYRTPANGTVYDNLSYRGYPSQQPGYCSPRSYGGGSTIIGTSMNFGGATYHNYQSSTGRGLTGTTMRFGNTSYTTLSGW